MSKKAIIITGGSGFIGKQVAETAQNLGFNPYIVDFRKPDMKNVDFEKVDITNLDSVREAFGKITKTNKVEGIIHLAALFNYSMPDNKMYDVNVIGTDNVARAGLESGISKLVNMGAVASYREGAKGKISENTPLHPFENYGKTKHMAEEKLFEQYHRDKQLKVATFRSVMVYGPFSNNSYIDGIFNMVKASPVIIAPMKDTSNSYVHTEDLGRAFIFALNNDHVFNDKAKEVNDIAYNLGDDEVVSERNILKLLKEMIPGAKNKPILPLMPNSLLKKVAGVAETLESFVNSMPSLPKAVAEHGAYDHVLDNSRLKKKGFTYKHKSVKQGLPEVVDWYMENIWKQ